MTQGQFSFDVDKFVGWTLGNGASSQPVEYYDGLVNLTPLIPKKFLVAFTVPLELANNSGWALTLPDGTSVPIELTSCLPHRQSSEPARIDRSLGNAISRQVYMV